MDKLDNMHKREISYKDKYNIDHYANISIRIKPLDKQIIKQYADNYNLSLAKFIVSACKYCIDNDIRLTDTESGQEDN